MMAEGDFIPKAANAMELGLEASEVSTAAWTFGILGTTLTFGVIEASESEAVSFPSMEVVGVRGGVARVTAGGTTVRSGVDG